ncbi:hypothetical protein [Burkholderia ambifaria]|uniref:hypothetical protein n=1 Tax=Burkholderia ambifaria TaxID=152480 RepID=UPI000F805309|nr:hypothetical protein [Burkholderia ambifaria]
MKPVYKLEDGQYAFYLDGECLMKCDEVGLLIDLYTGGVLKHGTPAPVEARFHILHESFLANGYTREAEDLVFIKGKFALEDLNKMLSICDYAGRFYRKHVAPEAGACVCDGTGEVDSGGSLPWGEFVKVPCTCTVESAALAAGGLA